jgi:hypothetical protein
MFPTDFKVRCITEIECSIGVPLTGYFIRNEHTMRLCYTVASQFKYISLASRHEAAETLLTLKPQVIDGYRIDNGEVKMYKNTLFLVAGGNGNGAPAQYVRETPVSWQSIELTPVQVQQLAAWHEWELAGRTMGKLVSISKSYFLMATG